MAQPAKITQFDELRLDRRLVCEGLQGIMHIEDFAGARIRIGKSDVRIVDECRGLQRLPRLLLGKPGGGELSELVVHQRQQVCIQHSFVTLLSLPSEGPSYLPDSSFLMRSTSGFRSALVNASFLRQSKRTDRSTVLAGLRHIGIVVTLDLTQSFELRLQTLFNLYFCSPERGP